MRWRDDRMADGGKTRGQFGALVTDIGDRDDLPEGGAGQRAHREQTPRSDAVAVYHGAILRDVDADMQGVRSRQALLEQALLFQFLSRAEKRKRVVAANMNGHFIDGVARSSDIGRAEIALPKVTRMRMAQTPATGDARKRMARRCFSAATGACR